MSKWIDFTIDERKAMIQAVSEEKQIDEASAEKDWWVTAVLYAIFHTSIGKYLLFKGGTSLSKGTKNCHKASRLFQAMRSCQVMRQTTMR